VAGSQEGHRCHAGELRIAPDLRQPGASGGRDGAGLNLRLDSDDDAPGLARTAIRGWSEGMLVEQVRCDALELLVSELVTNAVRHAGAPTTEPIGVTASLDEGEILVAITDGGLGSLPRMGPARGEKGGYGLRIVDRECTRWGVQRWAGSGTSVWFAI